VIATGRRQERLQELKDELGDSILTAQLDVRNRAAIEEMIANLLPNGVPSTCWSTMPVWRWVWSLPTKPAWKTGKT
jgi:hypothetical protein